MIIMQRFWSRVENLIKYSLLPKFPDQTTLDCNLSCIQKYTSKFPLQSGTLFNTPTCCTTQLNCPHLFCFEKQSKHMWDLKVFVFFQGSPRNLFLQNILMKNAKEKAMSIQQRLNVHFFSIYLMRLQTFKQGNFEQFGKYSDLILDLALKNHPLSCFLVAKELYKVAQNTPEQNKRSQCLRQCLNHLQVSLSSSIAYGGLFYIAEILQQLQQAQQTEIDELLVFACMFRNQLAVYKLCCKYKKISKHHLYLKYLKQAAENGILEAQHDLAIQYLRGSIVPLDEKKAFSWFFQASAHGFAYSKYNLALILTKGSKCGAIKKNNKAALAYLNEINQAGTIDVKDLIEKIQQEEANKPTSKNDPSD